MKYVLSMLFALPLMIHGMEQEQNYSTHYVPIAQQARNRADLLNRAHAAMLGSSLSDTLGDSDAAALESQIEYELREAKRLEMQRKMKNLYMGKQEQPNK